MIIYIIYIYFIYIYIYIYIYIHKTMSSNYLNWRKKCRKEKPKDSKSK